MLMNPHLDRYALRIPLFIWFTVCLLVLVFAFVQRDIHDTDIAFTYFMLYLTFPVGYLLAYLAGFVLMSLNHAYGIVAPGGFVPNLVAWVLFVIAGYFQWFVLLPHLVRRFRGA